MQSAAKLGVSVTVSPVGSDSPTAAAPTIVAPDEKAWKPALSLDEDGILHQMRLNLIQFLDSSKQRSPFGNFRQSPQQNALLPVVQECMDSITEHQRLQALMKVQLVKGFLPQSSIPAEYTVQRIRDQIHRGSSMWTMSYCNEAETLGEEELLTLAELQP